MERGGGKVEDFRAKVEHSYRKVESFTKKVEPSLKSRFLIEDPKHLI